jgi:hypothetical protein
MVAQVLFYRDTVQAVLALLPSEYIGASRVEQVAPFPILTFQIGIAVQLLTVIFRPIERQATVRMRGTVHHGSVVRGGLLRYPAASVAYARVTNSD